MNNIELGALGEKLAVKHLKKKKYKILEKNYKTKAGEIDIIAKENNSLVFVEVKSRAFDPIVSGSYAVDQKKRLHIFKTASIYIKQSKSPLQPRFDIIEVEIDRNDPKTFSCHHYENAFIWEGDYARF